MGIVTNGLYGVGERMLKSEFEQSVKVEFEGKQYPTFSCWDSYLSGIYGDYMTLPPKEKRTPHAPVSSFNFNVQSKSVDREKVK